jgi:acetolactate synthase I/II/III large subunit
MTGSRYFAEALHGYGVTHVFFVPTMLLNAMAEMEDFQPSITRIVTHGEKSAAYMADGYARASGKPGICMAQTIGGANLAAGLRDPYMACSPVIAVTGGRDNTSMYRNAYQEIEDFPLFEQVTKANFLLYEVQRFPDIIRQAFRAATTGTPRPVHIEMRGTHGQVAEESADLEVLVEPTFACVPPFRPLPEEDRMRAAVEALASAKRPVIVAGGGVVTSGAAGELRALAEKVGAPVATSLNAKAAMPDSHPLSLGVVGTYSRWCANRAVVEADLVFFVGSRTGGQVTNNWKIPRPGTRVIQLDMDPQELGRNYPNEVSLMGDAQVTLRRMVELAQSEANRGEWLQRVKELVNGWHDEAETQRGSNATPMRPERICREISRVLPENGVVVADTGHSGIWAGTMIDLNQPDQRFYRCAGSLGWGFPGALGVKCALPDRPVLCFTGDGGFYYHLAELETAARFGINAVILVNNNHSLNQETRLFNDAYGGQQRGGAHDMWVFKDVNFARVAEEMGCVGIRVEQPDQLADALQQAFGADRPVVVDVQSDIEALAARAWG